MKKLFLLLLVIYSCTTGTIQNEEENIEVLDKTVVIEVSTLQPNDAIYITYYDYVNDTHNWQQYFFTYDSEGNAEPIVLTFNDYDFRYVEGEIYRNNTIPTQLSLKIYVDDELVVDEFDEGEGDDFVNIKFNYDILTEENDV